MSERAPGIGQPFQAGSIAEDCQVYERAWVSQVIDGCVQAWPEGKGIKNFADTADRIGGPAAVIVPSQHALGSRQTVPGTPVLGKGGQRHLKCSNCLRGLVVVFQVPAAAQPPVARIAGRFGPLIKQGAAALGLSGVSQSSNQSFPCADVTRVAA